MLFLSLLPPLNAGYTLRYERLNFLAVFYTLYQNYILAAKSFERIDTHVKYYFFIFLLYIAAQV